MALDGQVTLGNLGISLQELASDGTVVGTAFTVGYTNEDTFTFTTEEGTPFELMVDELDTALLSVARQGAINVTWSVPNVDLETLAQVTGGTYSIADGYDAPAKSVNKDFKVILTPEQGNIITMNRVSLSGRPDGAIGKNSQLNVIFTGTLLTPVDGGSPYNLKPKA